LEERGAGSGTPELASWLTTLYRTAATKPEVFESYLHDAPMEPLSAPRSPSRTSLSWWTLLFMEPELPDDAAAWAPASMLLDTQGLAILRTRERYVSLECGPSGGGHGHPDRLHLTLHADGVHWLPDLGTGSYVAHDLFWYRSTLAHNAPRLDGSSQPPGDAHCLAFDVRGDFAWARGRYGGQRRSPYSARAVAGPDSSRCSSPWPRPPPSAACAPEGRSWRWRPLGESSDTRSGPRDGKCKSARCGSGSPARAPRCPRCNRCSSWSAPRRSRARPFASIGRPRSTARSMASTSPSRCGSIWRTSTAAAKSRTPGPKSSRSRSASTGTMTRCTSRST